MFNKQKAFNVKAMKGFTLIEVMIVVAIIGILASIATANYSSYVTRSSRGDAMEKLNEIMSQQQRYILRQRTYAVNLQALGYTNMVVTTDNGFYTIAATVCDAATPITRCVLLTATPVAGMRQVGDGALTLNSNRQKTHRGRTGWYQRT